MDMVSIFEPFKCLTSFCLHLSMLWLKFKTYKSVKTFNQNVNTLQVAIFHPVELVSNVLLFKYQDIALLSPFSTNMTQMYEFKVNALFY